VVGAEISGRVERGVGQVPQRQRGELGVDQSIVIIHNTKTYHRAPRANLTLRHKLKRMVTLHVIWRIATKVSPDISCVVAAVFSRSPPHA
jgi:hypothetical protein